jgi:oligopeptide/dipeptide ABC transporter ATP-binding protein
VTPLVSAQGLTKSFPIMRGTLVRRKVGQVVATEGANFTIKAGEVMGLVGGSGSGKSTIGRMILGLIPPDGGDIKIDGTSIVKRSPRAMVALRRDLQIVFQDPLGSLNPRRTAADNIALPMRNFSYTRRAIDARVNDLLRLVGLENRHRDRYPHELSGGQCQRIGIARALALNPRFLFLDEPVSALDVSIQAQILNLLVDLRTRLKLTYLFVGHDLKVVSFIADRIMVMLNGRLVEGGPSDAVYADPLHPYTHDLLAAALDVTARPHVVPEKFSALSDSEASEISIPTDARAGCVYVQSCSRRMSHCVTEVPKVRDVSPDRWVACHLY